MTPTPKLRFVDRMLFTNPKTNEHFSSPSSYRILQQWWDSDEQDPISAGFGQWRDVPLEDE